MGDTLGSRAVLGFLVPNFNTVVEPELATLRPDGVTNQTARFAIDAEVLDNVSAAASAVAACGPAALGVGLSTESLPGGLEFLEQAGRDVGAAVELPVYTASHATQAALRALGARTVAVVTPFDDASNRHVREALEANDFEVAGITGLACPSIETIGRTPIAEIENAFRRVERTGADAIAHIGTGLPTLGLVERLESELGTPIVSCNAALYWQCLRESGIDDSIRGFGRLLEEF